MYFAGGSNPAVTLQAGIPPELEQLFFDPQTSGGLLLSVPAAQGAALEGSFAAVHEPLWPIGIVTDGAGVEFVS